MFSQTEKLVKKCIFSKVHIIQGQVQVLQNLIDKQHQGLNFLCLCLWPCELSFPLKFLHCYKVGFKEKPFYLGSPNKNYKFYQDCSWAFLLYFSKIFIFRNLGLILKNYFVTKFYSYSRMRKFFDLVNFWSEF